MLFEQKSGVRLCEWLVKNRPKPSLEEEFQSTFGKTKNNQKTKHVLCSKEVQTRAGVRSARRFEERSIEWNW